MQLVIVVLTVAGGLITWFLNEHSKRRLEDYVRREKRYVALVKSLRGFQTGSESAEAKERFLIELELCWLYGSDEVVRAAYAFLETVKTEKVHTDSRKRTSIGNLMLAIRQDLFRRRSLRRTDLTPEEFQILGVNQRT